MFKTKLYKLGYIYFFYWIFKYLLNEKLDYLKENNEKVKKRDSEALNSLYKDADKYPKKI